MIKLLKILAGALLLVLILLVIAAIALPRLIDPNQYKGEIESQVTAITGREFTIADPIEWSLWPRIAVSVGGVSLADNPRFSDEPLASIGTLRGDLAVMPLLQRRLEVDQVLIEEAVIRLHADGDVNSWSGLLRALEGHQSTSETAGQSAFESQVGEVRISNSTIIYEDLQTATVTSLDAAELVVNGIGQPQMPVRAKGRLSQAETLQIEVDFAADVSPGATMRADDLRLTLNGRSGTLPIDVVFAGAAEMTGQQIRFDGLQLEASPLVASGSLSIDNATTPPTLEGELTFDRFSPKALLDRLELTVPATQNTDALTHFDGTVALSGSTQTPAFALLDARLDETELKGNLTLPLADPEVPIVFSLAADQLVLDDYLPPPAPAEVSDEPVTPAGLPKLNLDGSVEVGTLQFNGMTATNSRLSISARGERWLIAPIETTFYSGALEGAVEVNGADVEITQTLDAVQLLPMLRDLAEVERLQGVARVDLVASGNYAGESMASTLDGTVAIDVSDGQLLGFNLAKVARQVEAARAGDFASVLSAQNETTDFSTLSALLALNDGVGTLEQLVINAPGFAVEGSGQIDLVARELAIALDTRVDGRSVPLSYTGSFDAPTLAIDLAGAITARYQDEINDKRDELLDRAAERLFGGGDDDRSAQEADGEADATNDGDQPSDAEVRRQQQREAVGSLLGGLLGSADRENSGEEANAVDDEDSEPPQ